MSFLINNLIRTFLTQQAVGVVQREFTSQVEREIRARLDASEQASAIRDGKSRQVDFAVVFSQANEAVGLLDRCPHVVVTKGGGNSFHTFLKNDKRVVAVIPSGSSREHFVSATHAAIDIFRPKRLITAGFAVAIAPEIARFALCVPNVLIDTFEQRTIDLRQLQLAAPESDMPEVTENDSLTDDDSEYSKRDQMQQNHASFADIQNAQAAKAESTREFFEKMASYENLYRAASIVTTTKKHLTAAQKKELRQAYHAQLADQSAFPILDACQKRQVPVLPLRIITSTFDEELPRDAKSLPGGTHHARRFGTFLNHLVRRPSSAVDLIKLKQRHLEASDILAKHLFQLLESPPN